MNVLRVFKDFVSNVCANVNAKRGQAWTNVSRLFYHIFFYFRPNLCFKISNGNCNFVLSQLQITVISLRLLPIKS